MKLTKRGRIVRNLFITLLVVIVFYWLLDITTPKICKVPVSQMNTFCKELIYSK